MTYGLIFTGGLSTLWIWTGVRQVCLEVHLGFQHPEGTSPDV